VPRPLPLGRRGIYMLRPRLFSVRTVTESAVLCLVLIVSSRAAIAQTNNGDYILILASGFLCDPDHAEACPAVAKDANGSTFEMSGAGTFSPHDKSVTAAGTFTRKSSSGTVLDTGVWFAASLVSFDSYGAAPGALIRQGVAFGPRHMPMSSRPMPTGGLAVFRIRLLPLQGPSTNAVLQVNCALGEVPRERSVEGIRLRLERNDTEYAEEAGGRLMILAVRAGIVTPGKTSNQETSPAIPESPQN